MEKVYSISIKLFIGIRRSSYKNDYERISVVNT